MTPADSLPHRPVSRGNTIQIRDLRSLRILLLQPDGDEGTELQQHLKRIGCQVKRTWPPPREITDSVDIVFLLVNPIIEDNTPFHWEADNPPAVLIAVVDYENPLILDKLLKMRANAVIGLPLRPFGILANILLSYNNHKREIQLRTRLKRIQNRLQAHRTIEQAKSILMMTDNLSEQAAYEELRNRAMKRRTTIEIVSLDVIGTGDSLREHRP